MIFIVNWPKSIPLKSEQQKHCFVLILSLHPWFSTLLCFRFLIQTCFSVPGFLQQLIGNFVLSFTSPSTQIPPPHIPKWTALCHFDGYNWRLNGEMGCLNVELLIRAAVRGLIQVAGDRGGRWGGHVSLTFYWKYKRMTDVEWCQSDSSTLFLSALWNTHTHTLSIHSVLPF